MNSKALMTTMCLALAAASQCQISVTPAGWEVRTEGEGQTASIRNLRMRPSPLIGGHPVQWEDLPRSWSLGSGVFYAVGESILFGGDDPSLNYPLEVTHSGSVKAKFRWNGGGYNMPSPTRLWAKIKSRAEGLGLAGGAVSNGLGSASDNLPNSRIAQGYKIVKIEANGSGEFESEGVSISAKSTFNSFDGTPTVWGNVEFSALPPAYIGWVGDLEPTYFKGTNGQRVANSRTRDMGMKIDMGVTWSEVHEQWVATCHLEAIQSIYEHPDYTWSKSGDGTFAFGSLQPGDWSRLANFTMLLGTQPAVGSLNKVSNFGLEITNVDSVVDATLDNAYQIAWHYPYENWEHTKEPEYDVIQTPVTVTDNPPYAENNTDVTCEWNKPTVIWGASRWALDKSGALIKHPIWQGIKWILGIAINELEPEIQSKDVQFDECWVSNEHSYWFYPSEWVGYPTIPQTPAGYTLEEFQSQFYMLPKRFTKYKYNYIQAEHYDEVGYVSVVEKCVRRYNSVTWGGDYKLYDYNVNPGGPGGING